MKLTGKEEKVDLQMNKLAKQKVESFPLNTHSALDKFFEYLSGTLDGVLLDLHAGSLNLTIHCRTLEILDRMWNDYCSGHLDTVAEGCLVTDEIKRETGVDTIRLKTTILENDYLKCREFLKEISGKSTFQCKHKGKLIIDELNM